MNYRFSSLALLGLGALVLGHVGCSADATSAGTDFGGPSESSGDGGAGGEYADAGGGGSYANPDNGPGRPMLAKDAGLDPDAAPPACATLDPTKPDILYLSADDSNSMASPAIARRIIHEGSGVVPLHVLRTYEFLNYYNVPYAPADPGTLRVVSEMRPPASGSGDVELQIGVQAPPPATPRAPVTLTLVLDTSGSMTGTPIATSTRAVRALASQLRQGDIVNAVTWSTSQSVPMQAHDVVGPNDPAILALADSLEAGGGTDLSAGLTRGYQLANQTKGTGRINRVVIISDGQANAGITDKNLIGQNADVQNQDGIYLVGIGVGDGVNDTLMDTVTDAGNGAYVYLDSFDEADKMLGGRFDEVIGVAARDVHVKLTLPWYFNMLEFHGEQYSSDASAVKPQDLAPGDSMVFNQLLRACAASQIQTTDSVAVEATWKDPVTFAPLSASSTQTIGDLYAGASTELVRGSAIVAYAEALKKIAGGITAPARAAVIDDALAKVALAPQDASMTEIHDLLVAYKATVGK